MSPLKIKNPSKNLCRKGCMEGFNSGVKWLLELTLLRIESGLNRELLIMGPCEKQIIMSSCVHFPIELILIVVVRN